MENQSISELWLIPKFQWQPRLEPVLWPEILLGTWKETGLQQKQWQRFPFSWANSVTTVSEKDLEEDGQHVGRCYKWKGKTERRLAMRIPERPAAAMHHTDGAACGHQTTLSTLSQSKALGINFAILNSEDEWVPFCQVALEWRKPRHSGTSLLPDEAPATLWQGAALPRASASSSSYSVNW